MYAAGSFNAAASALAVEHGARSWKASNVLGRAIVTLYFGEVKTERAEMWDCGQLAARINSRKFIAEDPKLIVS